MHLNIVIKTIKIQKKLTKINLKSKGVNENTIKMQSNLQTYIHIYMYIYLSEKHSLKKENKYKYIQENRRKNLHLDART